MLRFGRIYALFVKWPDENIEDKALDISVIFMGASQERDVNVPRVMAAVTQMVCLGIIFGHMNP